MFVSVYFSYPACTRLFFVVVMSCHVILSLAPFYFLNHLPSLSPYLSLSLSLTFSFSLCLSLCLSLSVSLSLSLSLCLSVLPFLFPGNEIDPSAQVHLEMEETRKRSASEGNYEKKRKYQRKNSISSCAGFSTNSSSADFGSLSLDIDCSSEEFEVRMLVLLLDLLASYFQFFLHFFA